jgi:hypothetical protein
MWQNDDGYLVCHQKRGQDTIKLDKKGNYDSHSEEKDDTNYTKKAILN